MLRRVQSVNIVTLVILGVAAAVFFSFCVSPPYMVTVDGFGETVRQVNFSVYDDAVTGFWITFVIGIILGLFTIRERVFLARKRGNANLNDSLSPQFLAAFYRTVLLRNFLFLFVAFFTTSAFFTGNSFTINFFGLILVLLGIPILIAYTLVYMHKTSIRE